MGTNDFEPIVGVGGVVAGTPDEGMELYWLGLAAAHVEVVYCEVRRGAREVVRRGGLHELERFELLLALVCESEVEFLLVLLGQGVVELRAGRVVVYFEDCVRLAREVCIEERAFGIVVVR